MKSRIFSFIVILFSLSCSRWKVSELKQEVYCTIKSSEAGGNVSLKFIENEDILDLSFVLKISDSNIYLGDNNSKTIHVFSSKGEKELSIGPKTALKQASNYSSFEFTSIGLITDDNDGNIYVQNRLTKTDDSTKELSPSYVLIFSKDGKLQETLGQEGIANTPFYYIESLFTNENNDLYVVGRTFENWNLSVFKNRKRTFSKVFDQNFITDPVNTAYKPVIEKIIPFRKSDSVAVSVSYYDGTRFKYRKIFKLDISPDPVLKELTVLPDPRNELFTILDDKYLLFWEMDDNDIRFVIWSFQKNIVNNLKIDFKNQKSYYDEIISDENGKIYSYSVTRDGITISSWE